MNYLKGTLEDELERNLRMQDAFLKKKEETSHGSIVIKQYKYVYLVYKDNGKNIYKYVGIYSEELLEKLNKSNAEYKELKKNIKNAKLMESQIRKEIKQFND